MRKIGFLVAGVAALGLALAQSNVIKIATMSSLSGPQAALGEQIKLGAELAIEEAKPRFRQLGFELQLVPYLDHDLPGAFHHAHRPRLQSPGRRPPGRPGPQEPLKGTSTEGEGRRGIMGP